MVKTPCSKCGCLDTPKYKRYRTINNKKKLITSLYCILCNREDCRIRYEKIRNNKKHYKLCLERNRIYASKNREKLREYQKRYAKINAAKISKRKKDYYIINKKIINKRNNEYKKRIRKQTKKDNTNHIWRVLNRSIKNMYLYERL